MSAVLVRYPGGREYPGDLLRVGIVAGGGESAKLCAVRLFKGRREIGPRIVPVVWVSFQHREEA